MKPIKPDFMVKSWPDLNWYHRLELAHQVWSCVHPHLHPPVQLALIASIISLALLAILPMHPMSIPTAIGGGLAVGLLANAF